MALKQLYEGRKINEIRQICDKNNPVDAMTKTSPNSTLEREIKTNKVTMRLKRQIK